MKIAEQKHAGTVSQNSLRKPLIMNTWKVEGRLFGIALNEKKFLFIFIFILF